MTDDAPDDATDGADRTRQARETTERWFLRRGLPHFIHPYRATEDVFTRMLPVLALILVVQMVVVAADRDWSFWVNAAVVVGVLALLTGAYAAQNLIRKRPAFRRPDTVGPVELAVFVLLPTVPALVKADWASALRTGTTNLLLLGVISAVTSFGLVPMARWILGQGVARLASATSVLGRALPLVLLIVIVVFVSSDAWQLADGLRWTTMLIVVGLFGFIGAAFALSQLPNQIGDGEVAVVAPAAAAFPAEIADTLLAAVPADTPPIPPLSIRERVNVALVVLVSEGILVALVAVTMFFVLIVFGVILISPGVLEEWLGHDPEVLATTHAFGQEMVLTSVVVKVSAFLAGLSGLSFTVSVLSDSHYQREFLADLEADLDDAFRVRAIYRISQGATESSIISPT